MDIFKLIGIVGTDRKAARFAIKPVGSRLAARFTLGLIARGSNRMDGGGRLGKAPQPPRHQLAQARCSHASHRCKCLICS